MFLPAVIALVAENIGHVKSVGQMTGVNTDPLTGRAGRRRVATVLAGLGRRLGYDDLRREHRCDGGDAGVFDRGLLGGRDGGDPVGVVPQSRCRHLIDPAWRTGRRDGCPVRIAGILGVRIWLTNDVDFGRPINQATAAVALIIGIADFNWTVGGLEFTGIALGSIAALLVYQFFALASRLRGPGNAEDRGPQRLLTGKRTSDRQLDDDGVSVGVARGVQVGVVGVVEEDGAQVGCSGAPRQGPRPARRAPR